MKRSRMDCPPVRRAVWAMLAGELLAYLLLGKIGLPEPPRLALSLLTGAVAGRLLARGAVDTRKGGGSVLLAELPAAGDRVKESVSPQWEKLFPGAPGRQGQRLEEAAGLAGQLEEEARRLMTQMTASDALPELQGVAGQAKAALQAVQNAKKPQNCLLQAAQEAEKTGARQEAELRGAAFQANQLALRLQYGGEQSGDSALLAAAGGIRLLAARCSRCGGWHLPSQLPLAKELEECLLQAERALQELFQALQAEDGALFQSRKREQLLRQAGEELTGQAHALYELLRGRERETAPKDCPREGTIEGTALRYWLQ